MSTSENNEFLQKLLKAEEDANTIIRAAKDKRKGLYEKFHAEVDEQVEQYQKKKDVQLEKERLKYQNDFSDLDSNVKKTIKENRKEFMAYKDKGSLN